MGGDDMEAGKAELECSQVKMIMGGGGDSS